LQLFESQSLVIKAKLAKARSKVHISFDGRTAPNHRAFIGIVAYWSDENLKTGLIGLQRIKGSHDGENIAEAVLPVLKSFPDGRRVGCLGHIINLVAKAFLFGKDVESLEIHKDRSEAEIKELLGVKTGLARPRTVRKAS
jgi:hypothetical protein